MTRFVVGDDRSQSTLFPERLDDYLGEDNPVRAIDVFVDDADGSSNSWNATTTTASHPSQRKNPELVSTVARAIRQASQTLHRVHICCIFVSHRHQF
jgi:hypothetical protein